MTAHPSPHALPAAESRRERNKQRTLRALREAATPLFLEQGFDATTVDQIAERAGVSQRTFFRYFPCKEALLFGLEHAPALLDELRRRPLDEQPAESLRAAMLAVAPLSVDTWQVRRRLRRQLLATHPGVRAYALKLTDEQARGVAAVAAERLGVDPDRDPRPHVYGDLWAAFSRWVFGRGDLGPDPGRAIDEFFGTLQGFLTGYQPVTAPAVPASGHGTRAHASLGRTPSGKT